MTHINQPSQERNNLMQLSELVKALNESDFRAFPQKADPKRLTVSAQDTDGNRYFISRTSIGQNEDGTPKYGWVKGKQWRDQVTT